MTENKPADWMLDQIKNIKDSIKLNKTAIPYIYPEYQELHWAKQAFKAAKERLERAQKAWDRLGE